MFLPYLRLLLVVNDTMKIQVICMFCPSSLVVMSSHRNRSVGMKPYNYQMIQLTFPVFDREQLKHQAPLPLDSGHYRTPPRISLVLDCTAPRRWRSYLVVHADLQPLVAENGLS